jgi:hypothetical protein
MAWRRVLSDIIAERADSGGKNDDRLVDGVYREAGSLIAAPQSSANHTEIPALFRADQRDVERFGAKTRQDAWDPWRVGERQDLISVATIERGRSIDDRGLDRAEHL